jgi:hypothetical protein
MFQPLRSLPQTFNYTKTKIKIAKSLMEGQTEIWTFGFTQAFQSFST